MFKPLICINLVDAWLCVFLFSFGPPCSESPTLWKIVRILTDEFFIHGQMDMAACLPIAEIEGALEQSTETVQLRVAFSMRDGEGTGFDLTLIAAETLRGSA